jgi:hypothetical protein
LRARDGGVSIDALKEVLPVWKFLVKARSGGVLDLGELEYIARQHVGSTEGSLAIPRVIAEVMTKCCPKCRGEITIVYKNGQKQQLSDPTATIGFAIARLDDDDDESRSRWFASTRLSLPSSYNYSSDPTTVILGLKPNAALPQDPEDDHDEPGGERNKRREHAV